METVNPVLPYELLVGCANGTVVPGTTVNPAVYLCIRCNGLYSELLDLQSMLGLIE